MKIKLLPLAIFIISTITLTGQNEGNIWYYGWDGSGINFNPQDPFIANNSQMETFEGCATICDASGNLLFYTNGGGRDSVLSSGQSQGVIWNKNHQVMHNMGGVQGGGFSSRQSSVIVPKPGIANQYYLFTMDEAETLVGGPPKRGFSYFEIDMTLNGGLGDVAHYQEAVEINSREYLAACIHPNGLDYWVVINNYVTDSLEVFSVTNNGVQYSHSAYVPPVGQNSEIGILKISPDRSKLFFRTVLFDFDDQTGQLSNPVLLDVLSTSNFTNVSASFSPNSQYLYSVGSSVSRVDVTAANIPSTIQTIGSWSSSFPPGQMQVAPDGNIYFLESSFGGYQVDLSVIKCANSPSPCVEKGVISYPNSYGIYYGLPNFTNHFFENQAIGDPRPLDILADATYICAGDTVDLAIHVSTDYTILWSDGSTSPGIQVTAAGVYSVTIDDGCCNVKSATISLLCETSSIDPLLDEDAIKLIPNPTQGEVTIELSQEAGTIQSVEIYNIESKFISRTTGTNIQTIDLQDLSAGVYISKFTTEAGQVVIKRLVKY